MSGSMSRKNLQRPENTARMLGGKARVKEFIRANPDAVPGWMNRALSQATGKSDVEQISNPDGSFSSVRTASGEFEGSEVLFPTIRLQKNKKLKSLKNPQAYKEAIAKKDFLTFESPEEATDFSKGFSSLLDELSKAQKRDLPKPTPTN